MEAILRTDLLVHFPEWITFQLAVKALDLADEQIPHVIHTLLPTTPKT
jgi:hypothetical protein